MEGREKILYVERRLIIDVLNGLSRGEVWRLPIIPEVLPEGTEVVEMHDDYIRRRLAVIVTHPSFPPNVPGCELEAIDIGCLETFQFTRWELSLKPPLRGPSPLAIIAPGEMITEREYERRVHAALQTTSEPVCTCDSEVLLRDGCQCGGR